MERVVITGIGTVSPIGNNTVEFWESIKTTDMVLRRLLNLMPQQRGYRLLLKLKILMEKNY